MEQRVALITGASKGLGREIARAYARTGLRLVLTARGRAALEEAANELRGLTDILAVAGDVADAAHVERLVKLALARYGHIDVLVNNASELGAGLLELEKLPPEELESILRTNLVAPLRLIQLVLPNMRQRGSGLIVNVSSDAAVEAYPTWGGYGASKAALEHLSRVLAAEVEGSGVRVAVVDPGDMNTEMHRAAEPGVDLTHLPGPEVAAPAFVRLLDDPAAFGRHQAQQEDVDYVELGT
jgi:NAD(P)-dependent dehydrogenase (short-subunit alcohol dehydrogenase family)